MEPLGTKEGHVFTQDHSRTGVEWIQMDPKLDLQKGGHAGLVLDLFRTGSRKVLCKQKADLVQSLDWIHWFPKQVDLLISKLHVTIYTNNRNS